LAPAHLQQVLALQPEQKTAPIYSRAIAAMHFDKYEEAEKAVIHELESCEDDFDGWMMLAELYANHFNDLPAAEELLRETCEHPGTTALSIRRRLPSPGRLATQAGAGPGRRARRAGGDLPPPSPLAPRPHGAAAHQPTARQPRGMDRASKASRRFVCTPCAGLTKHFAAARPRDDAPGGLRPQPAMRRTIDRAIRTIIAAREELARLWAEELGSSRNGRGAIGIAAGHARHRPGQSRRVAWSDGVVASPFPAQSCPPRARSWSDWFGSIRNLRKPSPRNGG
jgi:hypothetical protein